MDREPVWVCPTNYWYNQMIEAGVFHVDKNNPESSEWAIVNWRSQKLLSKDGFYDLCWYGDDYSKGGHFVAYRYKT